MNDATFSALYEQYGHLVFQRCLRLLGHPADAEDAMHDVFIRAHRSAAPARSKLIWLYRVATNCCFDRLRHAKHVERQALRHAVEEPTLEVDGDRQALVTMVLRQVDRLTCEMGLLHHVDGLTQEEIAHECGYSRRTVGKKLEAFDVEFKARWSQAGGQS
ncbi:MAG: RNA polymerase sigma factor [Myxococcus sp.]|nr:RNA polymerase sigma factor [Myxococcus sp.]